MVAVLNQILTFLGIEFYQMHTAKNYTKCYFLHPTTWQQNALLVIPAIYVSQGYIVHFIPFRS